MRVYSRTRGWKLYEGSDDLAVDFYRSEVFRQSDRPIHKLIGVRKTGPLSSPTFHIAAPEEIISRKYHNILFPGTPYKPTPRLHAVTAVIQAHEGAEAYYGAKGYGERARFGSHTSRKVLTSEMLLARRLGVAEDLLKVRETEVSRVKEILAGKRSAEGISPAALARAPKYIKEMEETILPRWRADIAKRQPPEVTLKQQAVALQQQADQSWFNFQNISSPRSASGTSWLGSVKIPAGYRHPQLGIAAAASLTASETFSLSTGDIAREIGSRDEQWQEFLSKADRGKSQLKIEPKLVRGGAALEGFSSTLRRNWKIAAAGAAGVLLLSAFSGKDDYYNTIEGLNELGLAAKQRKILTDFGSGWRGLLGYDEEDSAFGATFKAFSSLMLMGAAGLTGYDRFGWKGAVGGAAIGAGLNLLGAFGKFENKEGSLSKDIWGGLIEGVKASASMSLIASSFMKGATIARAVSKTKSYRDLMEPMAGLSGKEFVEAGGIYAAQARHYANIIKEKIPGKIGQLVAQGFESNMGSPAMFDAVLKYGSIQDIPASIFLKANIKDVFMGAAAGSAISIPISTGIYLFSGKDDAYNTIEGLKHGGLASKLRRENTDFGSGYQGFKERILNLKDIKDENEYLQEKFDILSKFLTKYGAKANTGHQRIWIPKDILSEDELSDLNFLRVKIAIPEAGQTKFESWRSPSSFFHLHEHGDVWVMHEDEHESSTMTAIKYKEKGMGAVTANIKSFIEGLPHIIEEGLPGLAYYVRGQLTDAMPMTFRLTRELSSSFNDLMALMHQKISERRNLLHETSSSTYSLIRSVINFFGNKFNNSPVNSNIDGQVGRFSGKDDAYNTIEGLAHSGLAGDLRKQNTDFGSGFLGKAFGSMRGFIKASPSKVRKVLDTIKAKPVKEFTGWTPFPDLPSVFQHTSFEKTASGQIKPKSTVYLDLDRIKEEITRPIVDRGSLTETTLSDLIRVFKAHESSEGAYSLKFIKKHKITDEGTFYKKGSKVLFSSHMSPAVIVEELLTSMKLGPEAYSAMKSVRLGEVGRIKEGVKESINEEFLFRFITGKNTSRSEIKSYLQESAKHYCPPLREDLRRDLSNRLRQSRETYRKTGKSQQLQEYLKDYEEPMDYVNRVEKIVARVEKVYGPRFGIPTQNNAVNTIEGLAHGGLAQEGRHTWTPFGSKYDTIRILAQKMGQAFESFVTKPTFRESLKNATFVREVGHGAFGTARLYKGEFEGHAFEFVKKEIHEEGKRLAARARDPRVRVATDLKREGRFLRELGETATVPSSYGFFDDALYMEYMPGEMVAKWAKRNPSQVIPGQAKQELLETIQTAKEKGIANLDIHGGNILFDPDTGRASWIDFGLAGYFSRSSTRRIEEKTARALNLVPGLEISLEGQARAATLIPRSSDTSMFGETPLSIVSGPLTPVEPARRRSARATVSSDALTNKKVNIDNSRARESLIQSATQLRMSQANTWEWGRSGGRGHMRYTSSG